MIALRPEHLAAGCPICLHQLDLAHEAAMTEEAWRLADKFAELGYGAAFSPEVKGFEVVDA